MKSAILSTLTIIIRKGGMALKPFLPQLQTTFVKCLLDNTRLGLAFYSHFSMYAFRLIWLTRCSVNCRVVRSSAALALGKLSALSTRVDPLVGDLLSSLQVIVS